MKPFVRPLVVIGFIFKIGCAAMDDVIIVHSTLTPNRIRRKRIYTIPNIVTPIDLIRSLWHNEDVQLSNQEKKKKTYNQIETTRSTTVSRPTSTDFKKGSHLRYERNQLTEIMNAIDVITEMDVEFIRSLEDSAAASMSITYF
jgi:hypothetical protein